MLPKRIYPRYPSPPPPPPKRDRLDKWPFLQYPQRKREGDSLLTPPSPPLSPLGSPPARTPPPKVKRRREQYSPQVYPDRPVFNTREVWTPPEGGEIMSPVFGHSTPRNTPPDRYTMHQPEKNKRYFRWARRQEAVKKLPQGEQMWYLSPITTRVDAESFFDEPLLPFHPGTPPRSPSYSRHGTPPRSPAVIAMEEEIKKDTELQKYKFWWIDNVADAALRDPLLDSIHRMILRLVVDFDIKKLNAIETASMLREYLRYITEKAISQNLELPPLPPDHPALSLIEQKKITVRRIIEEYKQQNDIIKKRLSSVKVKLYIWDTPERREQYKGYRKSIKEQMKELDPSTRMERIMSKVGICFDWCPHYSNKRTYGKLNKPMEKELDQMRKKIVELETECMEAMVDMTQFVDVVSPNFVNNLSRFLRRVINAGREVIPPQAYDAAAKDLGKYLNRVYKHKKQDLENITKEINDLYPVTKEKRAEVWILREELEKCGKEVNKFTLQFKNIMTHSMNTEWMISDARKELKFYQREFEIANEALNVEKKQTAVLEAELEELSTGRGEISPIKRSYPTPSPIISLPDTSPEVSPSGDPIQASTPVSRSIPTQQGTSSSPDSLGGERPPSEMMNISDLLNSPLDVSAPQSEMMNFSGLQRGESFLDSLASSNASSIKKTVSVPSPGKKKPLQLDVELIPQEIRRSLNGQRVVCDVAIRMQEADFRIPKRRIEERYNVVRGTPPISQTVGRNVDRRYGMFTPQSALKRQYVGVRRPLFQGDFESPESPYGTGRTTHPELMNLPEHPSIPRPLDTTMEWENPEMNPEFRK